MTEEEFKKLPFTIEWHVSLDDAHTSTYRCTDERYNIYMSICVPYKNGEPKGRVTKHWIINGKTYKTYPKALEAVKDL